MARTLVVGGSNVVDVSIPRDLKLSAKHFSLSWDGKVCHLRDLGSATGTWLHGTRVDDAVLSNGAWIRAGSTDFMVYLEAHTPPPRRRASPLSVEHAPKALEALRRADAPLFGVVDASRGARPLRLVREAVDQHASLYEGLQGRVLESAAPYLVAIRRDSGFLERLLTESWGARWAIFLRSRRPFVEVRRHLRRFLMVENDDTTEKYYFRFYDPRTLRVFLPTCTVRQRTDFFGELTAFHAEGAQGELLTFTPDGAVHVLA